MTFLTPVGQPPAPATAPSRIGLSTGPTALPFATAGALTATASEIDFTPLNPQPTDTIVHHYTPAVVSPNGQFSVFGTGLDRTHGGALVSARFEPGGNRSYGVEDCCAPTNRVALCRQTAEQYRRAARRPTHTGVYQIRVGSSVALGDARNYRSNAVPLLIAALASPVPAPWNPVAGEYSFNGLGFVDGATELSLWTIELTARPLGAFREQVGFRSPSHSIPFTSNHRLESRQVPTLCGCVCAAWRGLRSGGW